MLQRRRGAQISGVTQARGRHPKGAATGIGEANMAEYVPTRHQPMIILVIVSSQPSGGTQQSGAIGEEAALD